MNTFGLLFRISILGESHGECVGVLIDGCPAGLRLSADDFTADLERRRATRQAGTTARKESDLPLLKSGIFEGRTSGSPLLILFANQDIRSSDYEKLKDTPRPGHADFVAYHKFGGMNDHRGGGHFSGRLTAALVAAGVVAKKVLAPVHIQAELREVGGSTAIQDQVAQALKAGDSIGGIVECQVNGLPVGLGEPFFDSVESLLSHVIFSIPAVKGIEFGAGFLAARMRGSECNDQIINASGKTATNNAGGINGGLTNGNPLIFRVAVKPTSSISKIQSSIGLRTGEQSTLQVQGRHDACIALRVPVVVEAAAAIVLLDLMLLENKLPKIMES